MDARAYRFDIVLRGRRSTHVREPAGGELMLKETAEPDRRALRPHRLRAELLRHRRGLSRGPRARACWPSAAKGERITRARPGLRRARHAAARRADRGLAGRRRRALSVGRTRRAGAADPAFRGWGRDAGDMETGEFVFETVKPGRVPYPRRPAAGAARHLLDRGARHQHRAAHADVLPRRGGGERRGPGARPDRAAGRARDTLIAARSAGRASYRFDIRLQGERETVFFDV